MDKETNNGSFVVKDSKTKNDEEWQKHTKKWREGLNFKNNTKKKEALVGFAGCTLYKYIGLVPRTWEEYQLRPHTFYAWDVHHQK